MKTIDLQNCLYNIKGNGSGAALVKSIDVALGELFEIAGIGTEADEVIGTAWLRHAILVSISEEGIKASDQPQNAGQARNIATAVGLSNVAELLGKFGSNGFEGIWIGWSVKTNS